MRFENEAHLYINHFCDNVSMFSIFSICHPQQLLFVLVMPQLLNEIQCTAIYKRCLLDSASP